MRTAFRTRITAIAVSTLLALVLAASAQSQVINEADSDQTGNDAGEFVELYGSPNTPLDGLVIVFFNGAGDVSYAAFDLDGFSLDTNGYFVLGNSGVANVDMIFAGNFLQNGADAVALYTGNAADFPNGAVVTTTNLLDALVYDTSDADDAGLLVLLNAGQPQIDENATGSSVSVSMQRCPDGGVPRDTTSYTLQGPTPGAANPCTVPVEANAWGDVKQRYRE